MEPVPQGVSQNGFKELRRVFGFLAGYARKAQLGRELAPRRERRARVEEARARPDAVKPVDEHGRDVPPHVLDAEARRLDGEIAALQRQLDALHAVPEEDKRVRARDLQQALAFLGKATDRREVDEMIWEVDENLDGAVDWEELVLMYRRNLADKSGLEPCRVFNVVQFCMYDRDFTGRVSLDETMHMLFARYGKERLEAEMRRLFGEGNGAGSLTFCSYLDTIGAKVPAAGGGGVAAAAAGGV